MKEKRKSMRGITLIALVVTIVVLLILAGVSISMLGGENGIIKQAVESKDKTKIGDEKERVGLAATAAKTENNWGEITEDNLAAELTKNIGERDVDYTLTTSEDKFKVTYTDTGNSYLVDKNGDTTECGPWTQGEKDENGNIPITNGKIIVEIGDIIDYDPLPDGEEAETVTSYSTENGYGDQTFSSDYTGRWKVIGVSEEGQILITPTDVIETTSNKSYYLQGQGGYANAVSELDKISEIFGHGYGAIGARSIRVENINKVTGYNPNNVGVYDPNQTGSGIKYGAGTVYEYGNEVTYYWKGDNYPYYTYKKSDGTVGTPGNLTHGHSTAFYWFDSNVKNWKSSLNSTTATTINMEEITKLRSNFYSYCPETLTNDHDENTTEGLKSDSKAYRALFNEKYWLGSTYFSPMESKYYRWSDLWSI